MAEIDWANPANGTFSVAANWTGGVVPGAADDAVIAATLPHAYQRYLVFIAAPVTVGTLTVASRNADVLASAALTAGQIALSAGALETTQSIAANLAIGGGSLTFDAGSSFSGSLTATGGRVTFNGATVTGSVTWGAATLHLGPNTVFANVTWHGALTPAGPGGLTVRGGLTLTDQAGTGPGLATLSHLVLDQVAGLDNATITLTGRGTNLSVQNSPTLTLGAGLTLQGANSRIAAGDTLVNQGTLIGGQVAGNAFINAGIIEGGFADHARSFTNLGTILVGAGAALSLPIGRGFTAGTHSMIALGSGNLLLTGSTSTAGLRALYAADHIVTTAQSGFALNGTLANGGDTLTIGAGSAFGTLYAGGAMTITGGLVRDLGGLEGASLMLSNTSFAETQTEADFGAVTFQNASFAGARTIDAQRLTVAQSTLTGVGTLNISESLELNGATIAAPAGAGGVTVNFAAQGGYDTLIIDAGQDLAGDSFNFGLQGGFASHELIFTASDSVDNAQFAFAGFSNEIDNASSAGVTFGAQTSLSLASGGLTLAGRNLVNAGQIAIGGGALSIGLDEGTSSQHGQLLNAGTIKIGAGGSLFIDPLYGTLANTGTILIDGGTLEASTADLVNSGALSVSNGLLVLDGPLTAASLAQFAHPNSELLVNGTLDLGGQALTFGSAQLDPFALSGTVKDGTLALGAGSTLTVPGFGYAFTATIGAALENSGTVQVTDEMGGADGLNLALTGNVTGTGRIVLGLNDSSNDLTVQLGGSVSAGQTLAFASGYDGLEFLSLHAATSFAGTLSGLGTAIEPQFQFDHATIRSAAIAGNAIALTFTTGAHATLATDVSLSGSLSFFESGGNAILSYTAPALAHH